MPRKIQPIYEKIKTNGGVNSINVNPYMFTNPSIYDWIGNGLLMSPYSEYIPLHYLFSIYGFSVRENSALSVLFDNLKHKGVYEEWSHKFKDKNLLTSILGYTGYDRKQDYLKNRCEAIVEWMHIDNVININNLHRSIQSAWSRPVGIRMCNEMRPFRLNQRSYSMFSTLYSMYIENNSIFTPHVLAVVLPENYLYMKYKMLIENKLDLSKVIILVDRELDTPRFYKQPFRKLYKETLLPKIMNSGCDVWKVPHEYIIENCFMDKFSLKGLNIIERRKTIEQIIEEFCNSFDNSTNIREPVRVTISDIIAEYSRVPLTSTYSAGIDPINDTYISINPATVQQTQ